MQASQNPEFTSVWQIPKKFERRDGWFNASLSFASSELAVVTDGGGALHIINTNIRTSTDSHTWEVSTVLFLLHCHHRFLVNFINF